MVNKKTSSQNGLALFICYLFICGVKNALLMTRRAIATLL